MKIKISLPIVLGLVVLLVGGLVLLKGKTPQNSRIENQPSPKVSLADKKDKVGENGDFSGRLVEGVREVEVTAKQFQFIPNPIKVRLGEKVRLRIKSIDVTHGFSLPDFGINENLEPGKEVIVELTADKKGSFPFLCSVYCGSGHSGMRGTLVIE